LVGKQPLYNRCLKKVNSASAVHSIYLPAIPLNKILSETTTQTILKEITYMVSVAVVS
jgi:hypothetical protein